jgi:DNA-binding NarL/FixJ family response regulator
VSGQDQQLVSAEVGSAVAGSGVVAAVAGAEVAVPVATLQELGLELLTVESVAELKGPAPALVVLFEPETLAAAAATEVRQLRESLAETPVAVVCAELRPGELRTALAAGVSGIVLEQRLDTNLLPCLRAVLSGQVCVPRAEARQVDPARLSPREKQILGLVVMGYMNGEIGKRLFVAESTVKSHLSSAFSKLGVSSRTEAVELILDPERGLGTGILSLGGEPLETAPAR